ncbi:MAG: UDP-N-acetylglucosamine 1-carboxyvinyltransferase [Planctomycetota bacterium]|nr:MAG: UDP-N-acetylglucosamine 1-carboxyvinyltransferase [Planctomycetota bacterium]
MDKFVIDGGNRLEGVVRISGSKNASLPMMAASLLTDETCVVGNVPPLADIRTMSMILAELGVSVERTNPTTIECRPGDATAVTARYELVSRMRASFCVLGPLVAKRKKARVSLPGGCVIGLRPIDLHIKGLRSLGARVYVEHGYVVAEADRLKGAEIYLGGAFGSSVTGTANVMMAATLAEGRTVVENAACEPEIQDLAEFLNAMGARISGIGTPRLTIEGVEELGGCRYDVIPDRIEAGTFLVAGAMTRGDLRLVDARLDHLHAVVDSLRRIGVHVYREGGEVRVEAPERPSPIDVTTLPYPGFPTDLQAQFMALLSLADGISVVTEKIYPDRFMHVAELNRMAANIRKEGATTIIMGVPELSGAQVMASDLRASAALVLAGLVAKGRTEVRRVYHIDRGYEKVEEKLRAVGAKIQRLPDE